VGVALVLTLKVLEALSSGTGGTVHPKMEGTAIKLLGFLERVGGKARSCHLGTLQCTQFRVRIL
jgi:hypothetical protein